MDDFDIRTRVLNLYKKQVDNILKESLEVDVRYEVLKLLVTAIKSTIDYLMACKSASIDPDEKVLKSIKSLVEFNDCLVSKVGLRKSGSTVFDKIKKQFTINEIGCDIGECIIAFKKTQSSEERESILTELTILLDDYNEVMDTSLTLENVLKTYSKEK